MKFTYEGSTYEIEFERRRRKKQLGEGELPSRLTTVRIYKTTPGKLPGELVREATAACSVLDKFETEKGRIAALRMVSRTLDRGFKRALWESYVNRAKKEAK